MTEQRGSRALKLVDSACSICGTRDHSRLVASGEDFEYRTSPDTFHVYRCDRCSTLFLHPRPDRSELPTIYPDSYHAFGFDAEHFGITYRMRRRIETRRLLDWCRKVPAGGAIIDIGSGDGFHLEILRDFGDPTWSLQAVEPDANAARALERKGLPVHAGFLEELALPSATYDFALMIMVIEHVDDPIGLLRETHRILRPGGMVGIVTDNIASPDARLSRDRYWGGYHFPRHFNLYDKESLGALGERAGFEVAQMRTMMSPVNWTYSVHNFFADRGGPSWLRGLFGLDSPLTLAGFSVLDLALSAIGRGALLRAKLRKPAGDRRGHRRPEYGEGDHPA